MKYLWLALVAWMAVGCMPAASTASGPAFVHPNFPYAVNYDSESGKSIMGEDWRLDTYRRKDKQTSDSPVDLERKPNFEATYEFDFDGDDKTDAKAKLPIPDLVFSHRSTSARLEVVTLLLDDQAAKKELRVLVNDLVASGSGTRSLFVGFGRPAAGVEKRYASRLIELQEASLGDQKGVVATIEQADLDELELDPKARGRMSRLFLMHAPFAYYVGETVVDSAAGSPSSSSATSTSSSSATSTSSSSSAGGPTVKLNYHRYAVLMLVEYSNTPDDYEEQYPEFLRLLGKIHPLSDERLLAYLAWQARRCVTARSEVKELSLDVSPEGNTTPHVSTGFDPVCFSGAVSNYKFAATGEERVVRGPFDFSKPIPEPEWFTRDEYKEEAPQSRAATPAAPAEAPPAPATQPELTPGAPSEATTQPEG